jgi:pimeloyl-ACP methyl ester carboxylesterase
MTDPGFIPFHALVAAPGATPARWMLVLHGILGSGGNFRTFARRVVEACPDWGMVLVDLRAHGQSLDAPPPFTVAAAAEDLVRLGEARGLDVRGVLGHSFGGKVALAYAEQRRGQLDELWVLDSTPSARPDGMQSLGAAAVLRALESLPPELPSRERFFELMLGQGLSRPETEWLAMNVRRDGDVFRFRLDLRQIRDLLVDYLVVDLWRVLEQPDGRRSSHVVIGGRSDTVSPADRARLAALAAKDPTLSVHILEQAGHWVHVDDPDGLFALVRGALAR